MLTFTFDNTISADTILTVISIVLSTVITVFGAIYGIVTSTKKYELRQNYKQELMAWYTDTVRVMLNIIHYAQSEELFAESFAQDRTKLLADLSAQVDIGRFYFPNILYLNKKQEKKPSAYRGNRHFVLECLMNFYKTVKEGNSKEMIPRLWNIERAFTSVVFDMIDPRQRNKDYEKYTEIEVPEHKSFYEFINDSDNYYLYR